MQYDLESKLHATPYEKIKRLVNIFYRNITPETRMFYIEENFGHISQKKTLITACVEASHHCSEAKVKDAMLSSGVL